MATLENVQIEDLAALAGIICDMDIRDTAPSIEQITKCHLLIQKMMGGYAFKYYGQDESGTEVLSPLNSLDVFPTLAIRTPAAAHYIEGNVALVQQSIDDRPRHRLISLISNNAKRFILQGWQSVHDSLIASLWSKFS